jgi:hypothetical protein
MGAAPRERLGVASGLLALSRTMGQVTGIPLIGAIFASRVVSVADLPASVDVTDAPPWAIVEGIQTAFTAGAGVIAVGVVLSAIAYRLHRQRVRLAAARESAPADR